jgi:hypothetical protein
MPNSRPVPAPSARTRVPPAIHLALEYIGFRNGRGRREYLLRAQWGPEARDYTVWIDYAAFADRQALLQDGPDICYQKLRRELADSEVSGLPCVGVTESDLTLYRESHASPMRRPPSPRPIFSARSEWMSASSLVPPDGRG